MGYKRTINRRRILLVEDSPTQAARLRQLLEREHYEVELATDGQSALEALHRFPVDLVISDIQMPRMDGYELSRCIKADPHLRELPVVLITTMSTPEDVISAMACGADDFVLEPYEESYLLRRLRCALANHELLCVDDQAKGTGVFFNGERHYIAADRRPILNLLLSTYESLQKRA